MMHRSMHDRPRPAATRRAIVALALCSLTSLSTLLAAEPGPAEPEFADGGSFDCLIVPEMVVALGVEAQGVIDEIGVRRGERVARGQTLATLRDDVERATLAQARDRVAMDSEIVAREADVEYTEQVLARQRSLLAQNLSSQQSVDEVEARHRVAAAALRRARDNALLDRHELRRQEALLAQRSVASPIDGVVVARHVDPGELVIDTPVVTVAALDTLRVEVVLPGSEFGRVRLGDTARVRPEFEPTTDIEAIVTALDPMLDAASGTFGIELTLDNAASTVAAGQECRVRFEPPVPAAALPVAQERK